MTTDDRLPDEGPFTGGCLCGAIRYEVSNRPRPSGTCHCRMCQRASGAPFQTFVSVFAEEVTWTKGTPKVARTSAHAERLFCGDCGSPLVFRYAGERRWGLMAPSLDEPWDFAPSQHDGVESKLPWLKLDDGLPEYRTEEDPEFLAAVEKAKSSSSPS